MSEFSTEDTKETFTEWMHRQAEFDIPDPQPQEMIVRCDIPGHDIVVMAPKAIGYFTMDRNGETTLDHEEDLLAVVVEQGLEDLVAEGKIKKLPDGRYMAT
jgi:hypothetical protein